MKISQKLIKNFIYFVLSSPGIQLLLYLIKKKQEAEQKKQEAEQKKQEEEQKKQEEEQKKQEEENKKI